MTLNERIRKSISLAEKNLIKEEEYITKAAQQILLYIRASKNEK